MRSFETFVRKVSRNISGKNAEFAEFNAKLAD